MKILKILYLYAALALLTVSASAEPLEKLAKKLGSGMREQKVTKTAVLAFQYHDGAVSSGSELVQERLTTYLAENGKVQVIERNLIKKLLDERKLEMSGAIDPKTTKELGKILGVSVVVIGTLNDLKNNETEVNARAVDTESGRIIAAGKTEIERTWTDAPVKPGATAQTPPSGGKYLGKPLVQIAILLDTSNSMDGLINQARTQIWRIVNEFISSEQKGKNPEIQVALYEYGNSSLPQESGYIRRLTPFTANLDNVSEMLFSLKTDGGDEYCGQAINDAVSQLDWAKYDDVYKAIFIAGNEPFTQGPVDFRQSVKTAAEKGIFVNTIYCGDSQRGIAEQWKAAALAGNGDYSNIDQQYQAKYIAAPQDDEIARLSDKLDQTQVPMGESGMQRQSSKGTIMEQTSAAAPAAALSMKAYRASAQNMKADAEWDAVAALASGSKDYSDIKKDELPQEMRKLSDAERTKKLKTLVAERKALQDKITRLNLERQKYLARQEEEASGPKTLEQAMLDTIHKQGGQKGLQFKTK